MILQCRVVLETAPACRGDFLTTADGGVSVRSEAAFASRFSFLTKRLRTALTVSASDLSVPSNRSPNDRQRAANANSAGSVSRSVPI
jgi:hypothetical protein